MNEDLKNQSNPFSTGGGGVNFETRVQAAFAISLLTQTCVPCLSQNMKAKELRFQNKYDGVNTDDFVLLASDKEGNQSKLYAQIKHEISIGDSTDSVFSEVIKHAWEDFKSDKFCTKNDSIALITGPLSKGDVHNVLPVLEWAKFSSCADDFIKKSTTKDFTSETKKNKLKAFKSQLTNANKGVAVSDDDLWQFLRVFYIISYDLDAKNSVVASLLCSHIQNYSKETPFLVLSNIVTCVQEFNQNAGVLTASNIPADIKSLFNQSDSNSFDDDITRLRERGDYIFSAISSKIKSVHIKRDEQLRKISELFSEYGFIFVTGARGTGKSCIVKDFVATKSKDVPVFYLRAEDLDKSHLNDVFTSIGMNCTLSQLAGKFSLLNEKILVIESIEKVLELTYQNAFVDLLQYIKNQTGWTIIATGRDYAYQQIAFNYLQMSDIKYESINIDGFNEAQIVEFCEHIPGLKALTSNDLLTELLKVPFFIEIAVRAIDNGAKFHSGDTETDFRNTVWNSVISKETDRRDGMPARRKSTFIEIAKQRAKKMVFGIRDIGFDPNVVSKLEEDNLIQRDSRLALISPSHDVLEDWALEEFIEGEYIDNSSDLCKFLSSIGNEPSINRAFRLWLYRRLKVDDTINEFINRILTNDNVENYWKDETIAAILQSCSAGHFLISLKSQLLKDDCSVLIRFLFILRISCQRPNSFYNQSRSKDIKSGLFKDIFLQPYGEGWESLINFTYDVRNDLSNSVLSHIVEVLEVWTGLVNINDDLPKASTKVGLLALWLFAPLKNSYQNENKRKKLLNVLLKVSPAIEAEFDELMDQDVFIPKVNPRRLGYVDELSNLALFGVVNVAMLCKRRPEFVIRLSLHEWLQKKPENDEYGFRSYHVDVDESFGLEKERDFFPASGAKGPFKYLLQYHPRLGLDFIIKLCNLTAKKYSESEIGSSTSNDTDLIFSTETVVKKVELFLNDGSVVEQFTSPHLWKGYRGLSTLPYLLQSALMALENWLIYYVSICENNEIEWLFNYLLKFSNSVMSTSVLASVAIGFPAKVGNSAFPILKCPELYHLDLQRMKSEMGSSELNWFAYKRDGISEIYTEERKKAAYRPWRKDSLETLLTKLQFDANHQYGALKIVDDLIAFSSTSECDKEYLRFMVHRIDTRTWDVSEDKENSRLILQSSSDLPEDLKQIQREHQNKHIHDNFINKLFIWSRKLFEKNIISDEYFSSYEDALDTAKNLLIALQNKEVHGSFEMAVGAITTTAAVCVRDMLDDLSSENQVWCLDIILQSVLMHADDMNGTATHDVTDIYGSGACAFVLSKFFDYELSEELTQKLKYAIATALTHANLNVSLFAAKGIRKYLWSINPNLASMCIVGSIEYAKFQGNEIKSLRLHYVNSEKLKTDRHNLITAFRNDFFNKGFNISVNEISLESHSSWFLHLPMIIVPFGTKDAEQVALIQKLVQFVFDDEYADRSSNNEKFNYEIKQHIQDCLTEHIIYSKDNNFMPFKDILTEGCSKAPSVIYLLKLFFDIEMQKKSDFDAIWVLWSVLAPEAHKIALNDANDRYTGLQNDLNKLLRGIMYSDIHWQGHANEQKIMGLGSVYLLEFSRISANNSHVFEALSSLMYHFHELFYDEGIYILSEKLSNDFFLISKQINTAYYLEMSIGRYLQIVNRGIVSRKMYNACIQLLTGLVETSSARAYYLRENLIRSRRISI